MNTYQSSLPNASLIPESGFNRRVIWNPGKSTMIQKSQTSLLNLIPKLPQQIQNKPYQSSDILEEIPYFEIPQVYQRHTGFISPLAVAGKKCIVINALIKRNKAFWIRPATLDEGILERVAKIPNSPDTWFYAMPGISILPTLDNKVLITCYGSSAYSQPSPSIESDNPEEFYLSSGAAIQMRKWECYADCNLSPDYDLWITIAINPELRLMDGSPCISIYFQEAKAESDGAVILGKYLNTPVMLYADAYSCNLWTELPMRAGTGSVESSFDQSRGVPAFPYHPIAHNSNEGIVTPDREEVFIETEGLILIQQYAEIIPANSTRPIRELPCMADISRPPSIDNLFNGFHLLGVIFSFTQSYCDHWLRGNWNSPKVSMVPIVSTVVGKTEKAKVPVALNKNKPTLANLLASRTIICELPSAEGRTKRQLPGLNGWQQIVAINSAALISNYGFNNDPDIHDGVCGGLSAELAVQFVRGNYTRNTTGDAQVNQIFLRAVAVQRELLMATAKAENEEQQQEYMEDVLTRTYLGIESNGFTWNQNNNTLEGVIPHITALERGQALMIQFTHTFRGNPEGHAVVFYRQAAGFSDRLLFMDANGGILEYAGDQNTSIEYQARHMLGVGSLLYSFYSIPHETIQNVGFVICQIPDSDEEM